MTAHICVLNVDIGRAMDVTLESEARQHARDWPLLDRRRRTFFDLGTSGLKAHCYTWYNTINKWSTASTTVLLLLLLIK